MEVKLTGNVAKLDDLGRLHVRSARYEIWWEDLYARRPGSPRCSKKVSSNESRWFLFFAPKSRSSIYKWCIMMLDVVRTSRLPVDSSQNWKFTKMRKKVKKYEACCIFPYSSRVSAFTRCFVRRKPWDAGWCWQKKNQIFTTIRGDHQSRWFLFQATIFGPKSRKSIAFAN